MPLLKLWNSLRGRSTAAPAREESTSEIPEQAAAPVAGPAAAPTASPAMTASKAPRKAGGLFRSQPHAALCKQLKSLQVDSVLEISVDDGSRAVAVMETLAKTAAQTVRYAAIDSFEMGEGRAELKTFFQTVRGAGYSPKLFPDSIAGGLRKVADTLGAIDLILIAAPVQQWQQPETLRLLSRITHENTIVLFEDGQAWQRFQETTATVRKAA